jgi:hypothetical protein
LAIKNEKEAIFFFNWENRSAKKRIKKNFKNSEA